MPMGWSLGVQYHTVGAPSLFRVDRGSDADAALDDDAGWAAKISQTITRKEGGGNVP